MALRRALDPVERYNQRLNRARSSNSVKAQATTKLPAQASPAPRSAQKERPPTTKRASSAKLAESPPPVAPSFANNPFLMADRIKKNPFLVADRKSSAEPSMPTADDRKLMKKAASEPIETKEPRPIGMLNEEQRAVLIKKRQSVFRDGASARMAQRRECPNDGADSSNQPDAEPEPHRAGQHQTSQSQSGQPSAEQFIENSTTPTGESFDPLGSSDVPCAPTSDSAEGEGADEGDIEGDLEPESGVQVSPLVGVPMVAQKKLKPAAAPAVVAPIVVAPEAAGDLSFSRHGAPAELLAAVSSMLPQLEDALRQAQAVEQTAEPLLDVVKRCQRGTKRRR